MKSMNLITVSPTVQERQTTGTNPLEAGAGNVQGKAE